jgi:chorismate mutase
LLRNTLDDIDFEIILLIKLRMSKVEKIWEIKNKLNIPVLDEVRKKEALGKRINLWNAINMNYTDIEKIYSLLHSMAIEKQTEISNVQNTKI